MWAYDKGLFHREDPPMAEPTVHDTQAPPRRLVPEVRAPRADTIEADYVVLPAAIPRPQRPSTATITVPAAIGMDWLSFREPGRVPCFARRGGAAFWAGGLALAAASFWIAGGHALVLPNLLPAQAAQPARSAHDKAVAADVGDPRPAIRVELAGNRVPSRPTSEPTPKGTGSFAFPERPRRPTSLVDTVKLTVAD